jgi:hypothetical protein
MEWLAMVKRTAISLSNLMVSFIIVMYILAAAAPPAWSRSDSEEGAEGFISSEVCGQCHKDIYDYWSRSLHRHSVDDPVFYVAYLEAYKKTEGDAKYLCTRCHAPTTLITKDYSMESEISREGVTCDFCHSVKAVDLASGGSPFTLEMGNVKFGPLREGKKSFKAHEVEYSKLHTESIFCAGCHEYRNEEGVLILGTYTEWKEGPYSKEGKQCQFCHMEEVNGKITVSGGGEKAGKTSINRHDVSGGHSIPMLKRAVEVGIVEVSSEGRKVRVVVDVTNKGSGHMVPTGIPSRKLIINVSVKTDKGMVLTDQRVYKKTLLDDRGNEITRDSDIFIKSAQIGSDNRLGPRETRREIFVFSIGRGEPVEATASASYMYKPLVLEEGRMEIELSSDSARIR